MMPVIIILSALLTIIYTFLISGYWYGWLKLKNWDKLGDSYHTKFSVIVPARNEAGNILQCVNDLFNQKYPTGLFEVIVVDDHSSDNTAGLVQDFKMGNLRLVHSVYDDASFAFKKRAIALGIDHAEGDWIVTTDADCRLGENWLASIAYFIESTGNKVVSGAVCFSEEKTMLQKFQVLDFMGLVGVGAGAISTWFPQVCNGANLAYEKKVFLEVNGFQYVDSLASGDDVLLLQKIAEKYPHRIGFLKSRHSIVYTKPMNSINEFFHQRARWASKSTKLVDKRVTTILAIVYLFNLSFVVNSILSCFYREALILLIFQFSIKSLVEFLFLTSMAGYFRKPGLMKYLLIFQPIHILYIVFIAIIGEFGEFIWKGRKGR